MMETCVRCLVSGRVQGVAYRAWTQRQALQRGLKGWAANLPDGRVEVVICGERAEVDALCAELREGPPAARVTGVEQMPIAVHNLTGFMVR